MLRRSLGLFVLGAGHIVLLYGRDVLTTYAAVCLVLLAMYRVRDRAALIVAGSIHAALLLSLIVSAAFLGRSTFMPSHDDALAAAAVQTQAMLGSPAEIVGHNLAGLDLLVIQAASLQGAWSLRFWAATRIPAR